MYHKILVSIKKKEEEKKIVAQTTPNPILTLLPPCRAFRRLQGIYTIKHQLVLIKHEGKKKITCFRRHRPPRRVFHRVQQ